MAKITNLAFNIVFLFVSLLFITGCAFEPSYRAQRVQPAYPEMVRNCFFLGGVTGSSNGSYTPLGLQLAKYCALDQAGVLGGTHIVWESFTMQVNPTAHGKVYRCPCCLELPIPGLLHR